MAGVVGVNHNVRQRHGSAVKRIAAGAGKLAVSLIAVAFVYRRDVIDILHEIAFAIVNVFAKLVVRIALDRILGGGDTSIFIIPYTCESVKSIVVIAFDIDDIVVWKTAPELGAVSVEIEDSLYTICVLLIFELFYIKIVGCHVIDCDNEHFSFNRTSR